MKKCFLTLLAIVLFISFGSLRLPSTAQAEEVQFELLGKLGGTNNSYEIGSFGDPIFDVSGGLQFSTLFRFDMGVGIGLNFNWTMVEASLDKTKLNYALEARDRYTTFQFPSIGVAFRYAMGGIADFGIWLNYGFGSDVIEYKKVNQDVAMAFKLDGANLEWDLQSVEVGIMLAFMYNISSINTDIVFGIQGFFDASRMKPVDSSLDEALDLHARNLDKNTAYTGGFHVVVGARYDLVFGNKKKRR